MLLKIGKKQNSPLIEERIKEEARIAALYKN